MKYALIIPYLILDLLILVASAVLAFIPIFMMIEDGKYPLLRRLEKL